MVTIPEVPLRSTGGGRTMPIIGLGTAPSNPTERHDRTKPAILEAIKVGYRHFDTASLYGSEKPVGEAIKEAIELGLIKSRDEVFITTKLWSDSAEGHLVLPAIKKSLENLGLEYVDLYLIHLPFKLNMSIEEFQMPFPADSIVAMDLKSVWQAMEECQNLGLTKAIGVSNFSIQKLQEILSFAKIPPAVNQVEMNPIWQQKKLREFCKENGIVITAYAPLGAAGSVFGDDRVMQSNGLQEIAESIGKTIAQVSLRWLYEQGVTTIPKSYNKERMRQNVEIFDFSLTEKELNKISQLPQRRFACFSSMVAGPNDFAAELDAEFS